MGESPHLRHRRHGLHIVRDDFFIAFYRWISKVLSNPLATKQYTVLFLPNSQMNLEPRVSCALHNSLPRAKDGKCQKRQGLNVLAVFPIPPSATSCTHLPLQGRQKGFLKFIRCGLATLSKVYRATQRSPLHINISINDGKDGYLSLPLPYRNRRNIR